MLRKAKAHLAFRSERRALLEEELERRQLVEIRREVQRGPSLQSSSSKQSSERSRGDWVVRVNPKG